MAEIVWTLEAAQWLEEIFECIEAESPKSALNVVTGIYEKIQMLGLVLSRRGCICR